MAGLLIVILSAAVSIAVAYMTARAVTYSKDVIGERQKWRARIREMAVEASRLIRAGQTDGVNFQSIVSEFQLSMNPDDADDREIINTLQKSIEHPSVLQADKFVAQVSRLLKHDWERAKSEARLYGLVIRNAKDTRLLRSRDYLDEVPKP